MLDPWMLKQTEDDEPGWTASMVQRISQRQFDKIILLRPLDPDSRWYQRRHLGPAIAGAINTNYVPLQEKSGYHIYGLSTVSPEAPPIAVDELTPPAAAPLETEQPGTAPPP